ncbi:flagellar basal body L-ring protein FlgH [Pelagibius litoralis]|uniref:Flagellar L-ring protein n=1 Tax=Pelagibius litoralis TaxID=374515 RepID=A0A967EY08_9PROT|nr:flagellar basal body L-ring protein FlgH [Pelagibius litoralis]NIA69455.1 flagellar basal body L-ring protein FlgH [Pelagibius litoralis]
MTSDILTKPTKILPLLQRSLLLALIGFSLSACNMLTRLSEVGEEPKLSAIDSPAPLAGPQAVSLPMPAPVEIERQPNSLWRPGSRAFLKDQRASNVGDILTVIIEIQDNAAINNTTTRTRTNAEDSSASAFLGYEASLAQLLPEAVNPTNLVDLDSTSTSEGSGGVNRNESINLRVAALVTQVLPNGNLILAGRQEVRVNYEKRELQVAGIIRPEDITSQNTIGYDQIAEARIAYGGQGQISDVQQPRYGQQVFDIIWPF